MLVLFNNISVDVTKPCYFSTPSPHLSIQPFPDQPKKILTNYHLSLGNTSHYGSDLAFMLTEAGVCCLYSVKDSSAVNGSFCRVIMLSCKGKKVFFLLAHKAPAQPVLYYSFTGIKGLSFQLPTFISVCVSSIDTQLVLHLCNLLPLALCSHKLK